MQKEAGDGDGKPIDCFGEGASYVDCWAVDMPVFSGLFHRMDFDISKELLSLIQLSQIKLNCGSKTSK